MFIHKSWLDFEKENSIKILNVFAEALFSIGLDLKKKSLTFVKF